MKVAGSTAGLTLALCLVAGAAEAQAQQPTATTAPARIAFVNARAALQAMPGYARAESTYVREGQSAEAELRRLQTQLDSAVTAFEQQEPMLSQATRATRRKDLETRNEQLQTRARELQQQVALKERELLQPMQERLSAIIDGLRAEGNYAMIIDLGAQGTGIITYDKSLDITQRVIQRLRQAN